MRFYLITFVFAFSACSDTTEDKITTVDSETCDLYFKMSGPCVYKNIKVNVGVEKIASDEKLIQKLDIVNQGNSYTLNISEDTSMLEGDRGYISFADINFDAIPYVAITTSFGLANLYVDYWVFDPVNKQYDYIGNFSELKINSKDKTLSNVVKINAANYENNLYMWQGIKLVKK